MTRVRTSTYLITQASQANLTSTWKLCRQCQGRATLQGCQVATQCKMYRKSQSEWPHAFKRRTKSLNSCFQIVLVSLASFFRPVNKVVIYWRKHIWTTFYTTLHKQRKLWCLIHEIKSTFESDLLLNDSVYPAYKIINDYDSKFSLFLTASCHTFQKFGVGKILT